MARLFMLALFPNEVNIFGDNEALEPILEICCASMIMFHNDVVGDIGYSNIVPSIMYDAAVEYVSNYTKADTFMNISALV